MQNLYCIRHGTSLHNVMFHQIGRRAYNEYRDTPLLEEGIHEALDLNKNWDKIDTMELVIVSPLSRTIETALNVFKHKSTPMISIDSIMEHPQAEEICNMRLPKEELIKKYPNIDFSKLDSDNDEMWDPDNIESIDSLLQRINKMYDFIETSNCKNIALVGHNSFISMMKYGKFLHIEDGEEELKHCYPYFMELKFD